MRNRGYIDGVDQLIERTSVEQVLNHFGKPLPHRSSGEHRMACVFREECHDSSYGSLTVSLNDAAHRIYCHACGIRGNLLTLIHGLAQHRPPSGDKLRGEEFKSAVTTLQQIHGQSTSPAIRHSTEQTHNSTGQNLPPQAADSGPPAVNIPLKDSENERARELVTLHEQLVVDPAQMTPAAAAYFRKRPWLTPEVARQWKMGYLPHSAKSLLRGLIVYAFLNERSEVLSYFGRDPEFERKHSEWVQNGKPEKGKPVKTRFVKGFHRGLELYGQHSSRLKDRRIKESLSKHGLVVVEGPNDVIRLDTRHVAAVGLCSNKATDEQIRKLAQFSQQTADDRILLLPDLDDEGEAGFKELLWNLCSRANLSVRVGWSRTGQGVEANEIQPEEISTEKLIAILRE